MEQHEKFVFLMLEAPYSTPLLGSKYQLIYELASSAVDAVLFFYIDGIHQGNTDQAPQKFENIRDLLVDLHKKYPKMQFLACSRCTAARGYLNPSLSDYEAKKFIPQKLLPFIKIVSIMNLGHLISEGYKIVQI